MVFLLIPVACAGYMYYKQNLEQIEENAGNDPGNENNEEGNEDNRSGRAEGTADSQSLESIGDPDIISFLQGVIQPQEAKIETSTTSASAPGPVSRWNMFCNNLVLEFEKSQQLRAQEASMTDLERVEFRMKQAAERNSETSSATTGPAIKIQA